MFKLNNIYRPITAQPFLSDQAYTEIQPCEALKPYICCFWGTRKPCRIFTIQQKLKMVLYKNLIFDYI